LPDRIFADTEISPETIAALVGFTYNNPEIYEITVDVVGYFDSNLGFMNPRRTPNPGAKVYLADDVMLRRVLNKKQPGEVGAAHIGSLLLRESDVPVALDVKELVSTHMAILAGTGSGKSYTAGVLIEELLLPHNRAAVLVFDPHGEYGTLTDMRGHPAFQGSDGYTPKVKILTPEDIRIRVSSLDYYDIMTLLPDMSDRQQSILNKAYRLLQRHKQGEHRWGIQDLIAAVREADMQVDEEGNEKSGSSAPALEWKLERLERSQYFHTFEHTVAPRDLFEPGQVTVLQMNEISQEEQQVICAAVLRQSNQARMNTQRELIKPEDENFLPYPVFIIVEEAHRFAPANEPSRCKAVLRTILSEGRKFGLGMGLITQRPGKIDSDVLSQCMSQFIMRIVNPVDQESLKYGVEAAGRDLLKELPALTKGQIIVAGACVNTPVLCKVRQRLTKHGGETLNAPEMWQKHFQEHHARDRQIQQAPVAARPRSQTVRGVSIE
jgi:DNA helicase HerA-like ATPase